MFNLYGNDRLTQWKQIRDSLEDSKTPFEDVAMLWSQAPFVNTYLNPQKPSEWPDPWHLILDNRYDDLAIALGMLYTITLTHRFMNTKCEIHTSMFSNEPRYFLVVDNKVLNLEYREVVDISKLENIKTNIVWSKNNST